MNEKLKPCPWCGGAAVMRVYYIDTRGLYAGCVECADTGVCWVKGPWVKHATKQEAETAAAARWNDRRWER